MRRIPFFLLVFAVTCAEGPTAHQGEERTAATGNAVATEGTVDDGNSEKTGENPTKAPQNRDAASTQGPSAPPPGVTTPPLEPGNFNVQWTAGAPNCNQDPNPPLQVHSYNKNLAIIRQNKCVNFEAPFIYLLFGAQKALLIDTGATASANTFPLRTSVESLLTERYGAAQRPQITLVVAHSHGHGDHRAADGQFTGQAGTLLVGTGVPAVSSFFGITSWPEQIVDYDLGGRILKVIPIPGHEASSLAFYDAQTGLLFTGDSLYPGRLYIENWEVYRTSMARLNTFAAGRTISHVLGAHIEISKTPGLDYPMGSTFHPDEHTLQLKKETLQLLDSELKKLGPTPARKVLDEFIISPN